MDRLINAMRKKNNISATPIRKTCQEFEAYEHLLRKARKLWREKGLLAKPDAEKGQQIPQNVKDKRLEFYQLDYFTRLCPGKKDFVLALLNGKRTFISKSASFYYTISSLKRCK